MKHVQVFILAGLLLLSSACRDDNAEPTCDGDCLFTLKDASGTVVMMPCFGLYGIKTKQVGTDSTYIFGIPDAMDVQFAVEGKSVVFSGSFRKNSLSILFPDPGLDLNTVFQVELTDID